MASVNPFAPTAVRAPEGTPAEVELLALVMLVGEAQGVHRVHLDQWVAVVLSRCEGFIAGNVWRPPDSFTRGNADAYFVQMLEDCIKACTTNENTK